MSKITLNQLVRNTSKITSYLKTTPITCTNGQSLVCHSPLRRKSTFSSLFSTSLMQQIRSNQRFFHTSKLCTAKDSVKITFVDRTGTKMVVEADVGDTLLDVAKDYDIDGVEGACGGTLACSTCHCIFKEEDFQSLELEDISEEELDMLDLAYGLTDTSRLVCAIEVTEEMDGLEILVPTSTNDARGEVS